MYRWSNGRKRKFDRAYPHRVKLTAEEEAKVRERRARTEAKAQKDANRPASTHAMSKRARCAVAVSVRKWACGSGRACDVR